MKILYIIPYVPYPLSSGGNQAFFNMANEARKQHEISLLLYMHNATDRENASRLQNIWPDVHLYLFEEKPTQQQARPIEPEDDVNLSGFTTWQCHVFDSIRRSMERKIGRRIHRAKLSAQKQQIKERQTSNTSESFLGTFVRENSVLYRQIDNNDDFYDCVYRTSRLGFDVVQIEFYEYLPLIYFLPQDVKKIFVHHEIHFVRTKNEMDLFDKVSQTDRLKFNMDMDAEVNTLNRYDRIITLTEVDKRMLSEFLPPEKLYVSPALTDANKEAVRQPEMKVATDMVFIGGADHFPNADGVIWFATAVLPLLRKNGIAAKLYVIGKWGENIQRLVHSYAPEIVFTGFVENLTAFINGKISVVPIRIGSGMRMKILDSINAGAPIVTTSKGCEGLPLKDGENCFIDDNEEDFARHIAQLLKDQNLQNSFVASSRQTLNGKLDSKELLDMRMALYAEIEQTIKR